jgi:hypothetical protein
MPFPGGGPQEVGVEAAPLSPGVLPVAPGRFLRRFDRRSDKSVIVDFTVSG